MAGERAHLHGLAFGRLTLEWKQRVDEELSAQGKTRLWLAERLRVTPGSVTYMLKPATKSSRLVGKTCDVLGIPPPEFLGEHEEMIVELIRFLNGKDPVFVQRLLGQAQKRVFELTKPERKSDGKK